MEQIVSTYLQELGIPISSAYCEELILSHPDYPSFLSISDTLEQLGINHRVAKVEKENLGQLSFPYLFLPNFMDKGLEHVGNKQDLRKVLERDGWSNATVLQADETEAITDPDHSRRLSQETYKRKAQILGLAAAGLLLAVSLSQLFSLVYFGLLLTAIAGASVGYFLLSKELGISYDAIDSLCRAGRKPGCKEVLQSEGAKLFGSFTLSDATLSYFLFQLVIFGLIYPVSSYGGSFLGNLSLFSALTIPIVAFSVYYQGIRVQRWCNLCLMVDGILLFQAVIFGLLFARGSIQFVAGSLQIIVMSGSILIVVSATIYLIKEQLKNHKELKESTVRAKRIQNNPSVFLHLLQDNGRVDIQPFQREMIIGNRNAPISLLMVANLSCNPCREGFRDTAELVSMYSNRINLTIRLSRSGNKIQGHPASTYLIEYWAQYICAKPDESEQTKKLFKDWYAQLRVERFVKNYSMGRKAELDSNGEIAEEHYKWVAKTKITKTPTYFINGYRMPQNYRIPDLKPHVPELSEYLISSEPKMSRKVKGIA